MEWWKKVARRMKIIKKTEIYTKLTQNLCLLLCTPGMYINLFR